ncbi:uncharacterized protein F5147DRAFT_284110 [Suillus discolor]|uniref:Uncharacterized protein n=1 Tax=Suillus discolor TaxID=1912936 RepID=A0A9P7F242_9AGAM|nr:uncharacterized protein F5147DRAFT_284110 [Suillus discolor]KAG2103098.1 hypothetical protein F5147DRAFT_284110 [Suillus discolor]
MQFLLSLRRKKTDRVHGATEFGGLILDLLKECLGFMTQVPCEGFSPERVPALPMLSQPCSGMELRDSGTHFAPAGDLSISSTGRFRKTYNLIMQMPAGLPPALGYTFFREHLVAFPASSSLIHRIAGITANLDNIAGNVLVVEHARGRSLLVRTRFKNPASP